MTDPSLPKSNIAAALGVLWCVAVLAAYYYFNVPYYAEKVGTFGHFLAPLLGL